MRERECVCEREREKAPSLGGGVDAREADVRVDDRIRLRF